MSRLFKRRRTDVRATSRLEAIAARVSQPTLRPPSFVEQAIQFATRYVMALLAWGFFNLSGDATSRNLSLAQINTCILIYGACVTVLFWHAWRHPVHAWRVRACMWLDLLMAALIVANDPYQIPPSLLGFIAVVLGNGMRFGMRIFAETLVGALLCGAVTLTLRYTVLGYQINAGAMFLCMFCLIIAVYAFILMGRVEQALRQAELASRTDPLTGLLNRRGLTLAASEWLRRAATMAGEHRLIVMLADLDNFKSINDSHGHAAGDRVLMSVAQMLTMQTRAYDLVARYGGDEFVLLLAEVDAESAAKVAIRVQTSIDEWMLAQNFPCGISIGVSQVTANELQLEAVLESVDRLLYAAKHQRAAGGQFKRDVVTEPVALQALSAS